MPNIGNFSPNFSHLQAVDEQLVCLGALAEKYYADDPNTSLIKMRQFGELLAKHVATKMGTYQTEKDESQYELLRRLRDEGVFSQEIYQLFGEVRRTGNTVSHATQGDTATALNVLKIGWQLGLWFHRTFVKEDFMAGAFVEPSGRNEVEELLKEREELVVIQSLSRAEGGYTSPSPAKRAAMQLQAAGHSVSPGQFLRFVFVRGDEWVRVWELGVDVRTVDIKRYCALLDRTIGNITVGFEKEIVRLGI